MKRLVSLIITIFMLTLVSVAQPTHILVLSKGHLAKNQAYFIDPFFPKDKVMQKYAEGFHIQDVSYGANNWTITVSDKSPFKGQVYTVADQWPEEFIADYQKQAYDITSFAYGDGKWTVVLSVVDSITEQIVHTDTTFSTEWVAAQADSGFFLTDVAMAYRDCKIVMSKGTGITEQKIVYDARFPGMEISKMLAGPDFRLTHLSYQDNKWLTVVSKNTIHNSQEWLAKNVFPANKIKESWEGGFIITQFQKVFMGQEQLAPPVELTQKNVEKPKVSTSCKKITRASHINTMGDKIMLVKGDKERLAEAQKLITEINACVKAEQVGFLAELIEKDKIKFEFIKWAYDFTYDLGEYGMLRESIKTKSLQEEFDQMVK